MAWLPISGTLPQFTENGEQANGYVLKFYEIGTTTPLTVAAAASGTPTTTSFLLDTEGYTTLSGVRVIPHVESGYKVIMYLNQTDADANDTGSAVWTIDNITITGTDGGFIAVDNVTALAAVPTNFFQSALVKGTTTVNDGGQATFYYDANSVAAANGTTIIEPDSGTGRWLILQVATLWLADLGVTTDKIALLNITNDLIANDTMEAGKLAKPRPINVQTFTASGTYTPTSGIYSFQYYVQAAGGGAGGVDGSASGNIASTAGAGGGCGIGWVTSSIAASYTVTIGAAGSGGAAGDNNGTAGGNSSLVGTGLNVVAVGGGAGEGAQDPDPTYLAGASGGTCSGATVNIKGGDGTYSSGGGSGTYSQSGGSFFGGGITDSFDADGEDAGSSAYGVGGGSTISSTTTDYTGGDGGAGIVIIIEHGFFTV